MSQRLTRCPWLLLASLMFSIPALADGIERDLHGGRATAQAGAMTARASEPSAVTYNPAAIVHLDGMQLQGGLDFGNATDDYQSASGPHRANHTIQFPPHVYATWRPESLVGWAFGIGLDTPVWYRVDWRSALFPARFLTRTQEARFFELHPVAAYALDDHWSVGGGIRYLYGNLEKGFNVGDTLATPGGPVPFELETTAEGNADGLAFDLAVHYDSTVWGFGAVYRSEAELDSDGDFKIRVRDVDPALTNQILALFPYDNSSQSFSLPAELRGGVWIAPYPELRIELDAALKNWSSLDDSVLDITSPTAAPRTVVARRDWDNTLSLRLGAEGEITDHWAVGGGIGYEPSPVSDSNLEPGFPRGDALVYALGGSYNQEDLSFDLGYALYDYDDRNATGLELANPTRSGTFSGHEQVWSFSARWRF